MQLFILSSFSFIVCSGCKQPAAPYNQLKFHRIVTKYESTPPRPSGNKLQTYPQAGIRFKHNNGAFGKKYLPETIGAGCAFIDYDNDGWQDILLVNSMNWPEQKGPKSFLALYHNNKDGTFTNVTGQAGLGVEMYGIGVAVGDYDNDGNDDIYITCVGPNHLFRNLGGGKFADVTAKAGVGDPGFSTSAAWVDYDNDGKLDLFMVIALSGPEKYLLFLDNKNKSYCTQNLKDKLHFIAIV